MGFWIRVRIDDRRRFASEKREEEAMAWICEGFGKMGAYRVARVKWVRFGLDQWLVN